MAEEIISTWETPDHLVLELIGLGRTRERWTDMKEAPMPGQRMELRVEDAAGKEIVFPVRLVSNTTFETAASKEGSDGC